MARLLYGNSPADFTVTPTGRLTPGAVLTAWTAVTGGTQVTDLTDYLGTASTVVTSDSAGLVRFYGPDGVDDTLWLDSGQGTRLLVRPVNLPTAALDIGTVTTGTAGATLTPDGTDAWTLDLVLPSVGANGVDTAAIQDKAVTAAKIADDTITAAQIAANAVGASELADNAVDTAAIQAGAVTVPKLGTGPAPMPTWITTFQSGHGWTKSSGTSVTDDTSVYVMGTQSLLIESAGAQKTGLALDLTGLDLVILLQVVGAPSAPTTIQVWAGTSGLAKSRSWTVWDRSNFAGGEWVRIKLPWLTGADYGSQPPVAAIDTIRIRVMDGTGSVNVQAVGTVPTSPARNRPIVSFTFDDGWASQTSAANILASYGIAGTAYLIPDMLGETGYLSVAQAQDLRTDYGWDLQAHSFDQYVGMTEGDLRTELNATLDAFAALGLAPPPRHVAYPGGANDALSARVVGEFFDTARTISYANINAIPPAAPLHLFSISSIGEAGFAINSVKTRIDTAASARGWVILTFHEITASAGTTALECSQSGLAELAAYALASGAEVLTVAQAWERVGRG